MRNIHISDVDGKSALCFDTGLDPRSFARTKMSQSLIEPGYVVYPNGSNKVWKSTGVNELNGSMRVWGPSFAGERLDLYLNNEVNSAKWDTTLQIPLRYAASQTASLQASQQAALQAIVFWIRAKMLFSETHSTLNPGAAFVACTSDSEPDYPKGSVFFAPENLSQRCLLVEGEELNRYCCPDLTGMEAVAFCAGAMLYKVLAQANPYPVTATMFQDMREGIFLPPNLAAPGLNENISNMINSALLLPVANKKTGETGTDILGNILQVLMNSEAGIIAISSLFQPLSEDEYIKHAKERKSFLLKQGAIVKYKRFVLHNKPLLIGTAAALFFIIFVIVSMTRTRGVRPTTEGMASDTVVYAYYDAFSSLNHAFMEACLHGADKSDVNVAINYFAVGRIRQTYENRPTPVIVPARIWKDHGGELPAPDVFGVTDLSLEHIGGDEYDGMIFYRANYLLWYPNDDHASNRSDVLTLTRHRGNWRISEINRTIN